MRLAPAALLLLLSSAAPGQTPECPDSLQLEQAQFTRSVRDRAPRDMVQTVPQERPAVYFFTHVVGGAGMTLTHEWRYGGEPVVRVRLPVGGDDWRTWSSKNLGLRRDRDWDVRVLGPDDCLLGRYTLHAPSTEPPALEKARERIQQDDLAGARLLVKETLAGAGLQPAQREALTAFLDTELELARVARQIEQNQLYTATARLTRVLERPLRSETRTRALNLRDQLQRRRKALIHEARSTLGNLEAVFQRTPVGALACPADASLAQQRLDSVLDPAAVFSVTRLDPGNGGITLQLLDRRTGAMHSLDLSCLRFPFLPPSPLSDD